MGGVLHCGVSCLRRVSPTIQDVPIVMLLGMSLHGNNMGQESAAFVGATGRALNIVRRL